MQELFKDILASKGVKGVLLFSLDGELIFSNFQQPPSKDPESQEWWPLFIASLDGIREADVVYEKSRIYVRKTEIGYLFIILSLSAPIAMIRLNCDVMLPSLKKNKLAKTLKNLFMKEIRLRA